ncbi:carboxypeptidase-like regulatory domain-containing protein, partial [Flavobacteriaceae bacterium]|nr:carboxypeptidase-like regulatory domain-containing protein [Flavobacteriaceae bacterium]
RYEGNWKDGKKDGKITVVEEDGSKKNENWKDGIEIVPFINISGHIEDKTGANLKSVRVSVEGTSKTVSTDSNGNYTIKVRPGQTLIVSYVGLKTRRQKIIKGRTTYSLTLLK